MGSHTRLAVLLGVASISLASAPAWARDPVPVPSRIPVDRGFGQRLMGRTASEKLVSQVRKLDPRQASGRLLEHFADQSNLSRMSVKEFSGLLEAAPDRKTRDTIYRRYVHYWTPSLGRDLVPIMKLSGERKYNLNKDYLLLRHIRAQYFDKNRYAQNSKLTGNDKTAFMWLAHETSDTPLKGRKLSTRDFLLTRFAKARGISLEKARDSYTFGEAHDAQRWFDPKPYVYSGVEIGP
jgi:hypothetical protein